LPPANYLLCRVTKLEGLDQDGWPHYSLEKPMPHMTLGEQEKMLKMLVCEYLENENSNL